MCNEQDFFTLWPLKFVQWPLIPILVWATAQPLIQASSHFFSGRVIIHTMHFKYLFSMVQLVHFTTIWMMGELWTLWNIPPHNMYICPGQCMIALLLFSWLLLCDCCMFQVDSGSLTKWLSPGTCGTLGWLEWRPPGTTPHHHTRQPHRECMIHSHLTHTHHVSKHSFWIIHNLCAWYFRKLSNNSCIYQWWEYSSFQTNFFLSWPKITIWFKH